MPLPSQVTTASILFGQATSFTGKAVELHLTITPTHRVVHAASGTSLVPLHESFTARAGEQIMVPLPHTDQPGFVDSHGAPFKGWAYEVYGVWKDGTSVSTFRKTFQVVQGQTSVDFDLIPENDVSPPITAPRQLVTSVNGRSGAVTIDVSSSGGATKDEVARAQAAADAAATTASGAVTAAGSALTAADNARTVATDASTRAGQAIDAIASAERRVDALKPGQPGGVVITDGAGRIPVSAIPPLPGAGLVLAPLPGHPRYLTVVQ